MTFWLAFSGVGPISFAYGAVAGGVVTLVASTIAAPFVVLPGWNMGQVRKLLRFGLPLGGASLLILGVFNVDSAIVGATLGPAALGFYRSRTTSPAGRPEASRRWPKGFPSQASPGSRTQPSC